MYTDRFNTLWVTRVQYDNHVEKHASEHGGEDNYLQEVRDAMAQVRAQPDDLVTGWMGNFQSGPKRRAATITYLGEDDNKRKYRVHIARSSGQPRILVVTNNGEVVTYHKND